MQATLTKISTLITKPTHIVHSRSARYVSLRVRTLAACCDGGDDAAVLASCVPPEPGSVSPYDQHILIRVPRPEGAPTAYSGAWWPPLIEQHPAVVRAFRALATYQSQLTEGFKPRISLWDVVQGSHALQPDHCDLVIFPRGVRYRNLHVDQIEDVVAHNLLLEGLNSSGSRSKPITLPASIKQERLDSTLTLFVCCHGSRDARCGILGPSLATALAREVKNQDIRGNCLVGAVSHIGGHKYAGNVVAYMSRHPADGDWFGGLRAEDAAAFVKALATIEIGVDGGAEDPVLRKWWRGRMGLSKHEQREVYEAGGAVDEVEGETEEEEFTDSDNDVDIEEENVRGN